MHVSGEKCIFAAKDESWAGKVGAHAWTERWDAVGAELRAALDADAFHAAADAVGTLISGVWVSKIVKLNFCKIL